MHLHLLGIHVLRMLLRMHTWKTKDIIRLETTQGIIFKLNYIAKVLGLASGSFQAKQRFTMTDAVPQAFVNSLFYYKYRS